METTMPMPGFKGLSDGEMLMTDGGIVGEIIAGIGLVFAGYGLLRGMVYDAGKAQGYHDRYSRR